VWEQVLQARFQVLTAVSMKTRAFWDVAPCSLEVDRRFTGVYCLHHQGNICLILHGATSQKALIFKYYKSFQVWGQVMMMRGISLSWYCFIKTFSCENSYDIFNNCIATAASLSIWCILLPAYWSTDAKKCEEDYTIRHPDMRVKHGSIWAFTSIAVTLCADVFIYKMESCSKTVL
jgi:hypothetical protein